MMAEPLTVDEMRTLLEYLLAWRAAQIAKHDAQRTLAMLAVRERDMLALVARFVATPAAGEER
jgi:hypothetical protein